MVAASCRLRHVCPNEQERTRQVARHAVAVLETGCHLFDKWSKETSARGYHITFFLLVSGPFPPYRIRPGLCAAARKGGKTVVPFLVQLSDKLNLNCDPSRIR
jgi:hypothetical protein